MRSLDGIVGHLTELVPQLDLLLGSQRSVVEHAHTINHAHTLLLRLSPCLFSFLLCNFAAQPEFAAEDDVLANEEALLTTPLDTSSNLLPLVADSGIGIQP